MIFEAYSMGQGVCDIECGQMQPEEWEKSTRSDKRCRVDLGSINAVQNNLLKLSWSSLRLSMRALCHMDVTFTQALSGVVTLYVQTVS